MLARIVRQSEAEPWSLSVGSRISVYQRARYTAERSSVVSMRLGNALKVELGRPLAQRRLHEVPDPLELLALKWTFHGSILGCATSHSSVSTW